MNNRIFEIIQGINGRVGLQWDEEDKEELAEFIVRECAGIYSKIDNGNLHMGTDNYLEALHKTFRS